MKKIGFLACYSEYDHKNTEYIKLSDATTILESDMVVLELEWLLSEYDTYGNYNGIPELTTNNSIQVVNDMKKRKAELFEFLNSGKTVVILNGNDEYRYRYTGRKEYSGTGKNTRVTNIVTEIHPYEILPEKITTFKLEGNSIALNNSKVSDFFQKYKDNFRYVTVYDEVEKNAILFKIQNTDKVVSFYKKINNGLLLFMPSLNFEKLTKEKGQKLEKQYFDDIYGLAKILNSNEEVLLPEYSNKYLLPNEEIMKKDIESEKLKLEELQKSIENKEKILQELQIEKIIFTGSGTLLEKMIVKELKNIGFQIIKYDENGKDEDIVVSYNDKIAVIEVKGVDGSATEKHTSQTVKWKSMYHIENDILPKGILIVNAFKSKDLENRQDTFPAQMLKYAKQQEICLLSTLQVYNIKCYLEQNPGEKDSIIDELYSTVGVYEKFADWNINIVKK